MTTAETKDHSLFQENEPPDSPEAAQGRDWSRIIAFAVLPAAAFLLAGIAGFLRYEAGSHRADEVAAVESVSAARDATIAILSYDATTVDKDLNSARDRLTGSFLDDYVKLTNEVVIPGAKEKQISAVAQVPAASSVSATASHAVALLFINQSTTVGNDAPTNSASSVRVTLDKVADRWLVSGFEPV